MLRIFDCLKFEFTISTFKLCLPANENLLIVFYFYENNIVGNCDFDFFNFHFKRLGKIVKYQLNFVGFHSCHEKWTKVGPTSSRILHGIQQKIFSVLNFQF
jgi:hypothetical protein